MLFQKPLSTNTTATRENKLIVGLQQDLDRVKKISERRLRKINSLTTQIIRLKKKNDDLYDKLLQKLNDDNVGGENLAMITCLNNNDLIRRFLAKQAGVTQTREFSQEIKKFAVTLHYLSPKAYTFIRDEFQNVLPHPKTISAWYTGLNCNPGFTSEAFEAIRIRVQQNTNKTLYCALAIDEMAIRKQVEWDHRSHNYYGFVNIGCELDSDSVPMATQALTFMVTCLNDSWKIPVGYFLIKSITAHQKSTLVNQCIKLIQECGICVVSLTYDGAASNIAMCNDLGSDISVGSVSFRLADSASDICLWPDPCHNIKLVRNALADKKIFIDSDNNVISWELIEMLVKLQENEGLHLGNKLRRDHINFIKQKMKVRLATQLFSNSVADALQYCKEKYIPGFENCEGTITFIRVFNNLFDIFNSRNMRAHGWKRALTSFNIAETEIFFEAAEFYIRNLKMLDGKHLVNSNRKTGFNGFLVCMKSLVKIYHNTVTNSDLRYICTYKMSQDHLELFFGAIRSRCGSNNNPSARTFQAAYKRLLVHAQFKDGSNGNCIPLDHVSILNYHRTQDAVAVINQSSDKEGLFNESESSENTYSSFSVELDHNYIPSTTLTEYSTDVVFYMAGFVVRKLKNTLKCEICIESLYSSDEVVQVTTLLSIKNKGGLITPSYDVFKICEATERIVRELKETVSGELLGRHKHVVFIINKVCKKFKESNIFESLIVHSFEQDFNDNHRIMMIKAIIKLYLTARVYHLIKQANVPQEKIRNFLTKTILFKGQ